MKKFISLSVAVLTIAACQQPAGTDSAAVNELRAEVDNLKLDIYGADLGTCDEANILADTSTFAASIEGLPAADVEGADWHTANGEREGVMTTPSGLQYMIVKEGTGENTPEPTDIIKVNYHGFFPDGEKFDSSFERGDPIEFPANGVIQGWIEAMGGMKPCEARTLYIPGNLAYGPAGRGSIPPNATLLFNVQLLGIKRKGLIQK